MLTSPHPLDSRPRNLILSQLPEAEYAALAQHFVAVQLPLEKTLSEPNQPIEFLYFSNTGVISTVVVTKDDERVEVGVIGREGFAGLPALLGQPQLSHLVVVQDGGEGLRIPAADAFAEFQKDGVFRKLVYAFAYLQMVQSTQSALCNCTHEVEPRVARWLLVSSDRMESDALQLTQEFLSQLLGVQRSMVSRAAGELQRQGLIHYSRGRILIVNRVGLMAKSCDCYGVVRDSYDRLLGNGKNGDRRYVV